MCQKEQFSLVEQGPLSEGKKLLYASPVRTETQDEKLKWRWSCQVFYSCSQLCAVQALRKGV